MNARIRRISILRKSPGNIRLPLPRLGGNEASERACQVQRENDGGTPEVLLNLAAEMVSKKSKRPEKRALEANIHPVGAAAGRERRDIVGAANRTVNRVRISGVQYLNTAPLVWGFTHGPLQGKYDLSFTLPSQCAEQLARGEADVAIIPSIECQRVPGLVVLPGISIASKHEVRSLLILSRVPIEEVLRLALDTSSRATAALVRLLVAGWWSRRGARISFASAAPDLAAMLQEADAALIIGDPALRLAERHDAGEPLLPGRKTQLYTYDVVSEWRAWTGRTRRRFPGLQRIRTGAYSGNRRECGGHSRPAAGAPRKLPARKH